MSARNGDRSRFHRERKQKIARRKRTKELLHDATMKLKSVVSRAVPRPGMVSA
jgi:hypothetical protein